MNNRIGCTSFLHLLGCHEAYSVRVIGNMVYSEVLSGRSVNSIRRLSIRPRDRDSYEYAAASWGCVVNYHLRTGCM
jgi:hypothetical protein